MPKNKVAVFEPFPFATGQKINIAGGPRKGGGRGKPRRARQSGRG